MLRTVPLSIIRSFSLYTQQWYISYRFADSLRVGPGRNYVSDSSSVNHQEFFTGHTAMIYVTQFCWQLASRIRTELFPSWSCSQAVNIRCMTYTIAVCTVKNSWWWIEELSKTCRALFQKYIWEISASSWFYYKNLWRCAVTWRSNSCLELLTGSHIRKGFSLNAFQFRVTN